MQSDRNWGGLYVGIGGIVASTLLIAAMDSYIITFAVTSRVPEPSALELVTFWLSALVAIGLPAAMVVVAARDRVTAPATVFIVYVVVAVIAIALLRSRF